MGLSKFIEGDRMEELAARRFLNKEKRDSDATKEAQFNEFMRSGVLPYPMMADEATIQKQLPLIEKRRQTSGGYQTPVDPPLTPRPAPAARAAPTARPAARLSAKPLAPPSEPMPGGRMGPRADVMMEPTDPLTMNGVELPPAMMAMLSEEQAPTGYDDIENRWRQIEEMQRRARNKVEDYDSVASPHFRASVDGPLNDDREITRSILAMGGSLMENAANVANNKSATSASALFDKFDKFEEAELERERRGRQEGVLGLRNIGQDYRALAKDSMQMPGEMAKAMLAQEKVDTLRDESDPNSNVSKSAREALRSLGIPVNDSFNLKTIKSIPGLPKAFLEQYKTRLPQSPKTQAEINLLEARTQYEKSKLGKGGGMTEYQRSNLKLREEIAKDNEFYRGTTSDQKKRDAEDKKTSDAEKAEAKKLESEEKASAKKTADQDKAVAKLMNSVGNFQEVYDAVEAVETQLGFKLEETDTAKGNLKVGGKSKNLPGVSLPWVGRFSPYSSEGRMLDSAMSKVFNVVLKDRSGAVIVDSELTRLRNEFAIGRFNTEAEMIKGMADYKKAVRRILKNTAAGYSPEVVQQYKDQGGFLPGATKYVAPSKRGK